MVPTFSKLCASKTDQMNYFASDASVCFSCQYVVTESYKLHFEDWIDYFCKAFLTEITYEGRKSGRER